MEFIGNLFFILITLIFSPFLIFFHYVEKYVDKYSKSQSEQEKKAEKEAVVLFKKNKDLIIDCVWKCIQKGNEGQIIFYLEELITDECLTAIIKKESPKIFELFGKTDGIRKAINGYPHYERALYNQVWVYVYELVSGFIKKLNLPNYIKDHLERIR